MSINPSMRRRRRAACSSLALICASSAFAADTTNDAAVAEVVVTGTRIQRDGMATPTPVTAVSAQELQAMAPTTLVAGLDQLPQFANNLTPATTFSFTGNSGGSILNLRGLQPVRTLTLLDGRRIVPSTRLGSTDVSILPEALVQRVDVVTGGASAAYGSDAVAGVVNFILDTKYNGLKADVQAGVSDRGDNQNYKFSVAGGTQLGERMHLIAAADYFKSAGIETYEGRDWNQGWFIANNPNAAVAGQPARLTLPNLKGRSSTPGGLIVNGPLAFTQFLDDGTPAPFNRGNVVSGTVQSGGSGFDLANLTGVLPETKRSSQFAYLDFDINDDAQAYVQLLRGYSYANFAEAPNLMSTAWQATVYIDNAFLPESLRQRMISAGGVLPTVTPRSTVATPAYPNAATSSFGFGRGGASDLSHIRAEMKNTTESFTTGIKGKYDDWRYNAYYQFGQNHQTVTLLNLPRVDRMYRSLDSVVDSSSGRIVCRSTLSNPNDGCVPGNFFGNGRLSQEAIDYIVGEKQLQSLYKQHFAEATVDGDIFEGWAGPVSLALGASYRLDSVAQHGEPPGTSSGEAGCTPTAASQGYYGLPPAFSGCYGIYERGSMATVVGDFNVKEVFAETLVPLLKDAPFARALDFTGALRYAYYSGSGGVTSWKTGLEWTPFNDLRLRATLSRDTRAGNLAERFDFSSTGSSANDPFLPGNPNYVFTQTTGGDPNIQPEDADTKVIGFVYQPAFVPGFALSVDYYDIKIDGAIGTLTTQQILDRCFQGATELCGRITRGADGRVTRIIASALNFNQARTTGIDIESSYRHPITVFGGAESLSVRAFFSTVTELSTTVPGAPIDDNAGQTGIAGGAPDWRGTLSLGYLNGPFSINVQERWISSGTYDASWVTGRDIDDNKVGGALYTNLRLGYELGEGKTEVFLNVSNLFDRDPALAPAATNLEFFGSNHTNESLFDKIGRTYTLGVKLKL